MPNHDPTAATNVHVAAAERKLLDDGAQKTIFASGSILGAITMSSCCIFPLALFSIGVTGAWIGNLTALYPYKIYFFLATAIFLGGGFYKVYSKPKPVDCLVDSYCASPIFDRLVKTALWASTVLAVAAMAFPYAAPFLLDY